ncbi:hypothetical protein PPSIR1_03773 [Plesiocystis pacifica SIR-1]|uniref:Uncharacterized protein n=1 Tax=Plesiocystis pacifica SIR-1 TaxID=391625 RepID=A6G4B3_9BACT|nr:hypothetical protein [Plesiocystis pacifica]EDM79225.1 hypothetical protein PPSIR1_03773 [Plesiocystis pacifica SIR-1]
MLVASGLGLGCQRAERPGDREASVEAGEARGSAAASKPSLPALPAPGEWVVIAEEATLYTAPDRRAPSFPTPAGVLGPGAGDPRQGPGVVMEVVEVLPAKAGEARGDRFLHLVSVSPEEAAVTCVGGLGVESDYELHVYAPMLFLREVSRGEQNWNLGEGSRFAIAPGTPVSGEPGARSVHVGELKIPMPLHEDALGWSFSPAPIEGSEGLEEEGPALAPWPMDAPLHFGSEQLKRRGPSFARPVAEHPTEDGELELHFRHPCGSFVFRGQQLPASARVDAEPEALPLDPSLALAAAGVERLADRHALDPQPGAELLSGPGPWKLPEGAELRWAVGGEPGSAGRTRREVEVEGALLLRKREACLELAVGLLACVDRELLGDSLGAE